MPAPPSLPPPKTERLPIPFMVSVAPVGTCKPALLLPLFRVFVLLRVKFTVAPVKSKAQASLILLTSMFTPLRVMFAATPEATTILSVVAVVIPAVCAMV